MSRRAILQIGTEKTGSTTLQHFLATNRAGLAQAGYLYPRFCGALNHTGLAAYALDPARRDAIRTAFGAAEAGDVPAMRARLRREAAAELAGAETAIFCSEHCHSRLRSAAEVETLRDFLRPFFDEVRISVYLRRQDQVALSLYSTRLKSGSTDRAILPRTDAQDTYFNYDRSLAMWENAFGDENVQVRLFDRAKLVGGDVVVDFLTAWGLGSIDDYTAVRNQNESIRPVAQEYLRLLNTHLQPIPGLPLEDVRGPLAASLARRFPGRGARPARAAAEAFYAKYRASNEAVRARHFPDLATLFDEDFSSYPEAEDPRDVDLDAMAAVAAELHAASVREVRRLEAEIAIRDGRLAWARGEAAEAERALRRALGWRPDHPDTHRALAEHMLRQDRLPEAAAAAARAIELKPASFEYAHFLGLVLRRSGDFDAAEAAQMRALELKPDHPPSRRELDSIAAGRAAAVRAHRQPGAEPCPRPLSA